MDTGLKVLNQKLSHELEEWCKFVGHIKAISHNKKLHKTRSACRTRNFFYIYMPVGQSKLKQLITRCLKLKMDECKKLQEEC
jgi:hypothetical protein